MNEKRDIADLIVPEKKRNVIVRISVSPPVWLGKREEILNIFDKMKKLYGIIVKIEE